MELLYSKYTQSVDEEEEQKEEDAAGVEEKIDHDARKDRATVAQYSALVRDEVAQNLKGLARARLEKHAKPTETNAKINEAYIKMTSGGGTVDDFDGDEHDAYTESAGAAPVHMFPPVRWDFSSQEEMLALMKFEKKGRIAPLAKDLLALLFMSGEINADAVLPNNILHRDLAYTALAEQTIAVHQELIDKQTRGLEINTDEADIEQSDDQVKQPKLFDFPDDVCFATQNVYETPSQLIRAMVEALPATQTLTRDQLLFVMGFAAACDEAWEDMEQPPARRRVHHMILLGQGGSVKTHVVKHIIFTALLFIWPSSHNAPTLQVVAMSNAQAKNISSSQVKARTVHNACGMRVQRLVNPAMRPGGKLEGLTRTWDQCKILVIEE